MGSFEGAVVDPSQVLRTYYPQIDAGDAEAACLAYSENVRYCVPRAGEIETAERMVINGRAAVRDWITQRPISPVRHDPVTVLAGEADGHGIVLIEGVLAAKDDGRGLMSFMASAHLDATGLVDRYVAYAGRPLTEGAEEVGVDAAPAIAPDAAAATIDRYFHSLETGDFEDAVDCFSADTVYAHPPYRHTGITNPDRVTFRGHEELLAAFRRRGVQTFRHRIDVRLVGGSTCLFEGEVVGLPNDQRGTFMSSARFDADGRIKRYVSFYTEPSPPR
jgi:ketosteroid isomerase-like protein